MEQVPETEVVECSIDPWKMAPVVLRRVKWDDGFKKRFQGIIYFHIKISDHVGMMPGHSMDLIKNMHGFDSG